MKRTKQKEVLDNELEVAEWEGGSKSLTKQDSGCQAPAELEAGAGESGQLRDAGASGQVAGKPRARIRAYLEKSRVPTSFKTLEQ